MEVGSATASATVLVAAAITALAAALGRMMGAFAALAASPEKTTWWSFSTVKR